MTREEYKRLPKPPNGMWLESMQQQADKLKKMYMSGWVPDPDEMMEDLIGKATDSMKELKEWSNLDFLSYTYWAVMEEAEFWNDVANSIVANETERVQRAEGMIKLHVLTAWLHAINRRIEELGGKVG